MFNRQGNPSYRGFMMHHRQYGNQQPPGSAPSRPQDPNEIVNGGVTRAEATAGMNSFLGAGAGPQTAAPQTAVPESQPQIPAQQSTLRAAPVDIPASPEYGGGDRANPGEGQSLSFGRSQQPQAWQPQPAWPEMKPAPQQSISAAPQLGAPPSPEEEQQKRPFDMRMI